jgi:hypothetical protein
MKTSINTASYHGEGMIRIKDHKQQQLFDPWAHISPKRRKMLDDDWPGLFRQHLLEQLPVEQITPYFKEGFGRPCKELHTVLGVLLFQQTMDLSDRAAIEQLCFNIQWHYALNIPEESDDAKYISEKSLYTMRRLIIEHQLDKTIFDNIGDKLAAVFAVDTKNQRIDSVHIKSNMRKLGRITIFSQTIAKFLVNLKRHHRQLFDNIDATVSERYVAKNAQTAFSMVKPSESEKTLKIVSADLFDLIEQFKDYPAVSLMHSYKLMQRVLAEQCNLENDKAGKKVTLKKPSEIASDSLQNPSDPDATYSGHKGQGYQVQIMETFCRSEDKAEKQQRLKLITHAAVQRACESDATALVPAITDTKKRQLSPDELLADTLYGGDTNHQAAKADDVQLIAPVQKGNATNTSHLTGFCFNENGYVISCPAGHSPDCVSYKKKTGRFSATFNQQRCQSCPLIGQCKLTAGKNKFFLRYSNKQCRIAVRRAAEQTEPFADIYRWRAGVEATMSEFDRRTGVKKLRVRGMPSVRFAAIMKAAGLNILRAGAVRKARRKAGRACLGINRLIYATYTAVKEQILKPLGNFRIDVIKNPQLAGSEMLMAA